MICVSVIMINNWPALSVFAKKLCKDLFAKGLNDIKPEVQKLAKAGLVSYLALKPVRELHTIAAAYTKNSDVFAEREKRKRKLTKGATTTSKNSKTNKTVV